MITPSSTGPREVQSYYNSTKGIELYNKANSTASNIPNFISSVLLTKENLPNGSIIIVDEGYQYRPEGWINETTKNTSASRPAKTSSRFTVTDDVWWGSYTIRAFNLSASVARKMLPEDAVHLRIYIPKNYIIKINGCFTKNAKQPFYLVLSESTHIKLKEIFLRHSLP